MNYTGQHAKYYDLFYADKPYRDEAQYAAGLIEQSCPGAATVLDLGCGSGLRSLEMARLGYKVSGIDQSAAMIELARQHLSATEHINSGAVDFAIAEITDFRSRHRFDAIISLFHVFSYLTTLEQLIQAVSCSFANLRPGGVLLFDYWHGPGVLRDPPTIRRRSIKDSLHIVERTSVPTHLPDRNLVELQVSLKITERTTNVSCQASESYHLRYWFPEELQRQLCNVGFVDIRHYGWMTHGTPAEKTWQACTLARKPS